MQAENIMILSC